MTDRFFVDLDHLTTLARRLDESRLLVEAAAVLGVGLLGVGLLDDAWREFRHRRRAGLARLAADLARMRDGLTASASAYRTVEDGVVEAVREGPS